MGKAPTGKVPKQLEDATARLVEKSNKGLGMKWATSKAFSVRLPPHLEAWVESLENRSEWIRQAIAEKYEREQAKRGQLDGSSTSAESASSHPKQTSSTSSTRSPCAQQITSWFGEERIINS